MGITLKPPYLKRYKDIALLFMKYGRGDLVANSGLDQAFADEPMPAQTEMEYADAEAKAEALASDLERMGPIFTKLGQVLSSRGDLLPPVYTKALARLQDNTAPFSFGDVERIVEEELGVRLSKAFAFFDSTPIATASLGQVHHARLRDNPDGSLGRDVVVKVQRPDIRDALATDLGALHDIAEFLDEHTDFGKTHHLGDVLREFRKNLALELDYRQEARNLVEVGNNLRDYHDILVPRPIDDYTSARVLTMEFVAGKKITAIGPLAHLELDGSRLADALFDAYLNQILVDGVFHADPHPGNIFITEDRRIALLDLGMIGRVSKAMQEKLLRLLLAVSEGRSDQATELALNIGEREEAGIREFNEYEFQRKLNELIMAEQGTNLARLQIGRVILEFTEICAQQGLRLPGELTMLAKCLLNLDEIGRLLDPAFDPNAAIERHSYAIMQKRMIKDISPSNIFSAAIEAKEFVQELPGRVNKVLDILSRNHFKVHVDAIAEETLIEGFQKVSNRITTGLILAALIIGASMLMHIQSSFTIFGYPGLAMICFLGAAGGGFWLVIAIALADRRSKQQAKHGPPQ